MPEAQRPTLFSGPLSMFGAKAQIAAAEKGIAIDLVMVPFDMATLYSPKHPEVARINPKRQVPVLVHGAVEIFDSTQIFEYFEDLRPEPPLWPRDVERRAMARRLELESDEVFFPPVIRLMGLQRTPQDEAAVHARAEIGRFYDRWENLLDSGGPHLTGPDYTYADIAFYMAQIFADRMGAPMGERHRHLNAWRGRLGERPAIRAVAGAMGRYLLSQKRPIPEFLQRLI